MRYQIEIEEDIPMPTRRFQPESASGQVREAYRCMRIGESFTWHENKVLYHAARKVGVKIKTAKLEKGGFRVWRIG